MPINLKTAGKRLCQLRLERGLTMRDVQAVSRKIAGRKRDGSFIIVPSRLSDIENGRVTPSIYRLYSLSVAYRCPMRRLLRFYGLV